MKIKLTSKVKSYSLGEYSATQKKPVIDVPDDVAEYLISTGNFAPASSCDEENITCDNKGTITTNDVPTVAGNPEQSSDNELEQSDFNIAKMTVAQLDELAEQVGCTFDGKLNKEQKIAALTEFLNNSEE